MKKKLIAFTMISMVSLTMIGCSETNNSEGVEQPEQSISSSQAAKGAGPADKNEELPTRGAKGQDMQRQMPEGAFEGEVVIPEGLSEDLKDKIEALPEMAQHMIVLELPEEITEEVEAELIQKIEMIGSKFSEGELPEGQLPQGKTGRNGMSGHDHGGMSQQTFQASERISLEGDTYKDGTYTGTADGYAEDLQVSITIDNNEITNIEIISHNETKGFYEPAFEQTPDDIINNQSTDVDTVSGATYTSQGIILAVEEALAQAME